MYTHINKRMVVHMHEIPLESICIPSKDYIWITYASHMDYILCHIQITYGLHIKYIYQHMYSICNYMRNTYTFHIPFMLLASE